MGTRVVSPLWREGDRSVARRQPCYTETIMLRPENRYVALWLIVSVLLIVVMYLDRRASSCEADLRKELSYKQYLATQNMFEFISLWATQFLEKQPERTQEFQETAKNTAKMAQDTQNAFIGLLNDRSCAAWSTAGTDVLILAFILNAAAVWLVRRA